MCNEIMQRDFRDGAPTVVNANEPHMACLFLLDTSSSMDGEPIKELNDGINRFKEEACMDKKTQNVLDVAIVEFNTFVKTVLPFTPITMMEPINLIAGGGTDMVSGLRTAIDMVNERYRFYRRGAGSEPYCPWIVMITDGYPNEFSCDGGLSPRLQAIAEEIRLLDEQDKMRLWSLAVSGANESLLMKLGYGKRVLRLKGYDFSKFFDWVNKSMRAISASVPGQKAKGQELPDNVDKVIEDDWM